MKVVHFVYVLLFVSVFSAITVTAQNNSIAAVRNKRSYSGNIAVQWMNHITAWIKNELLLPGPSLRIFAYTGLAIYESQLPGMKNYQSIYSYFVPTGNHYKILFKKDATADWEIIVPLGLDFMVSMKILIS